MQTEQLQEVTCKLADTPVGWVVVVLVNGNPVITSNPEREQKDAIVLAKKAMQAALEQMQENNPEGKICMVWHDPATASVSGKIKE